MMPQDGCELFGIQLRLGGIDVRVRQRRAGLLGRSEHLPDGLGEALHASATADVHEHHARSLAHEVVVERRHLEAVVECDAHHRVDLVLRQHHVPHHHRLGAHGLERRP